MKKKRAKKRVNTKELVNQKKKVKKMDPAVKKAKEVSVHFQKAVLCCFFGFGISAVREVIENKNLQSLLLSLVPLDLAEYPCKEFVDEDFIKNLAKSFGEHFSLGGKFRNAGTKEVKKEEKKRKSSKTNKRSKPKDKEEGNKDEENDDIYPSNYEVYNSIINGSRKCNEMEHSVLFASLCRSLGMLCRLVVVCNAPGSTKVAQKLQSKVNKKSKKEPSQFWTEIFLPQERYWTCVDLRGKNAEVGNREELEGGRNVGYVLAFNFLDEKEFMKDDELLNLGEKECEGVVVSDLTRLYSSNWGNSVKIRLSERLKEQRDWVEETLEKISYQSRSAFWKAVSEKEMEIVRETRVKKEKMPTSEKAFKNHPVYCLEKFLITFELLRPSAKSVGVFQEEKVFLKEDVGRLHTIDKWTQENKSVREGEKPAKVATNRDKVIDLYGEWQVEPYRVPEVEVPGIVPKNEYGNVYLFYPDMLPVGTEHIPYRFFNFALLKCNSAKLYSNVNDRKGLTMKLCKKLGIDAAKAMVGWQNKRHGSAPEFDGLIVCQGNKQIVLDAWQEQIENDRKKAEKKRLDRIYSNWKKLFFCVKKMEVLIMGGELRDPRKKKHERSVEEDEQLWRKEFEFAAKFFGRKGFKTFRVCSPHVNCYKEEIFSVMKEFFSKDLRV